MSITYCSNIVVDLSPGGVFGWPGGMGVHRLRFSVQYQSPARKEIFVARNFRASVSVSRTHQGSTSYLGMAWPEKAWTLRTSTASSHAGILFDLDLSGEQLARIEDMRHGGDLMFSLNILCEVSHGDETTDGFDEVRFPVNQSAWVDCLKHLGQDRIVLLEVDLPANEGELKAAASLLKHAQQELSAGNYDGVVRECRLAIESVQKILKLRPEIDAAVEEFKSGNRRKMSKRARALLVDQAVLHYAHPAHHVDDGGETFDYGRRDAIFMLALASAVVANSCCSGAE